MTHVCIIDDCGQCCTEEISTAEQRIVILGDECRVLEQRIAAAIDHIERARDIRNVSTHYTIHSELVAAIDVLRGEAS